MHDTGRMDRLESKIDRLDQKLDRISDEVSAARGREGERAKWFAALVGVLSAVTSAIAAWALGMFGKH